MYPIKSRSVGIIDRLRARARTAAANNNIATLIKCSTVRPPTGLQGHKHDDLMDTAVLKCQWNELCISPATPLVVQSTTIYLSESAGFRALQLPRARFTAEKFSRPSICYRYVPAVNEVGNECTQWRRQYQVVTTAAGLHAECSQSECSMSVRTHGLVVVPRPPASHSQRRLFIVVTNTTTTMAPSLLPSQSSSLRRRGHAVCALKKHHLAAL